MKLQTFDWGVLGLAFLASALACAAESTPSSGATGGQPISSSASLISYCQAHSSENAVSEAEVSVQKSMTSAVESSRWMPQIDVFSSVQRWDYSEARVLKDGQLIANSGTNPIVGASISYDLQKLFGPESELAQEHEAHSRVLHEIAKKNVTRLVKKNLALFRTIQHEIEQIQFALETVERINGILLRQRKLGVFTEVEEQQLRIQRSLLASDLAAKKAELEVVYSNFSNLTALPVGETRKLVDAITDEEKPFYERTKLDLNSPEPSGASVMSRSINSDFQLVRKEHDSFRSFPLPTVFAKTYHQWPSMPSFQGPNQVVEVGLNVNVTAIFNRLHQKEELGEKLHKSEALKDKALIEYRNAVQTNAGELKRRLEEQKELMTLAAEMERALPRSFHYYEQKRMDSTALLDIASKSFLASQRLSLNKLQVRNLDAELEYLLAGEHHE